MAEDPLVTHARTRIGRTLRNKWTLDKLLGVGGMAAVYECTHRNGSKVAIKMLHPMMAIASSVQEQGSATQEIAELAQLFTVMPPPPPATPAGS